MQASGQYGAPEVPQFVVGRVPSAHSHMFSLSHDMSQLSSSPHPDHQHQHPLQQQPQPQQHNQQPLQQQQQQQQNNNSNSNQIVAQKIRLGSDSPELVPSPPKMPTLNNTDSYNKQVVSSNPGLGPDDDVLGGEDSERGSSGNRWPRQETLALLKIRSEMDANFRDASLKGPLWEDISRCSRASRVESLKEMRVIAIPYLDNYARSVMLPIDFAWRLADLGYFRSGKKCKEKFENVHKYYKRTKEGRAGRQDGKSYRFFSQLEALYGNTNNNINNAINTNNNGIMNNNNKVTVAIGGGGSSLPRASPLGHVVQGNREINSSGAVKGSSVNPTTVHRPALDFSAAAANISFSSDSSDDEYDEPGDEPPDNRKRKRTSSSSSHSMMVFFENLMKQVMEKQEAMQQKFLEAIEKREQDRMIREEAWKRQEMARLSREQELKSQERSLTASRDAAFVAFLQKVTGQTIQIPELPAPQLLIAPADQNHHHQVEELHHQDKELIIFNDPNSKRWPKPEVHTLIKLRSGMEQKFHGAGPKGALWEEISAGMACLGYNRSAKRCKEKWENINKYFRKAKESNKKRPENAKTCPYFHQLDALYRKKVLGNANKQNRNVQQDLLQNNHDEDDGEDQDQDDQDRQEELTEQQPSGSNREDSAHNQGHGDGAENILAIMPPPGSEAVTYDRTNSSTTRDASFMAMVHKLTADPPEFNMSTSSNTE
eukprot:Gb_37561 [translate_table: standard]